MSKRKNSENSTEFKEKNETEKAPRESVDTFSKEKSRILSFVSGGVYDASKEKIKLQEEIRRTVGISNTNKHVPSIADNKAKETDETDEAKQRKAEKWKKRVDLKKKKKIRDREELAKTIIKSPDIISSNTTTNESIKCQIENSEQENEKNQNTNLYLSNLSPSVTEEMLYKHFIKFGDIESIKITAPKIDNTTLKIATKNIAFINFFKSDSAKAAMQLMEGKLILGQPIRLKCGKQVTSNKFGSNSVISPIAYEILPHVYISIPEDLRIKEIIDKFAKIVSEEGYSIEKHLIELESGTDNPDFHFLLYQYSPLNIYYRWRVYSFLQGDTETHWRQEPFQYSTGGNIWHPPRIPSEGTQKEDLDQTIKIKKEDKLDTVKKEDTDDESDSEEEKPSHIGLVKLKSKKLIQLQNILLNLTGKRKSIQKAMVFCFDNVACVKQIVPVIHESFSNVKTPQEKIKRLLLLSDLLYNSGNINIFNSWCYKKELESTLPDIFEELGQISSELRGKKATSSFNDQVKNLLSVWKKWKILEDDYLRGLEFTFTYQKRRTNIPELIKHKIEKFEDHLLEVFMDNEDNFRNYALKNGISTKGSSDKVIGKLVALKENILMAELEKNEKLKQDTEIDRQFRDYISQLDKKITHLKQVLDSFQTSYSNIKEYEVDGIQINPVEFEYLGVSNSQIHNNKTISIDDEDLDGEPI